MNKNVVKDIVANKEWEKITANRHIISCGGTISLLAIVQATKTLDKEAPNFIVTSEKIWEMIKQFGTGVSVGNITYADGSKDEETIELLKESEEGVGYSLMGLVIYVDKDMPDNILIVGSKSNKEFAKVEVY